MSFFSDIWNSLAQVESIFRVLSVTAASFTIIAAFCGFLLVPIGLQRERLKEKASEIYGFVTGKVFLEDNLTPENTNVKFLLDGKLVESKILSESGTFNEKLPQGNYIVEFEKPAYDSFSSNPITITKGSYNLAPVKLKVHKSQINISLRDLDNNPINGLEILIENTNNQNLHFHPTLSKNNNLISDTTGRISVENIGYSTLYPKIGYSKNEPGYLIPGLDNIDKLNSKITRTGSSDSYILRFRKLLYSKGLKENGKRIQGQIQNVHNIHFIAQGINVDRKLKAKVFGISINDQGNSFLELRKDADGVPGEIINSAPEKILGADTTWGEYPSRPNGLGSNYQSFLLNNSLILTPNKYWVTLRFSNLLKFARMENLGIATDPDFSQVMVSSDGLNWAPATLGNGIKCFDVYIAQ